MKEILRTAAAAGLIGAIALSGSAQLRKADAFRLFPGEAIEGRARLMPMAKGESLRAPQRLGERTPLVPPFCQVFDDYPAGEEYNSFERFYNIINADGDKNPLSDSDRTWGYYNYSGTQENGRTLSKAAYLQYPINVAQCDDWLIPWAIKVEAGKYYRVTVDASIFSGDGTHRFEVKMGEYNDADGMTIDVIPPTDVNSLFPTQSAGWFVPEFDGLYYMGIHGISYRSASNRDYLFVDNISMEKARSGKEPAEVSEIEAVSDPNGLPQATISFKAPAKNIAGNALSGTISIAVTRDGSKLGNYTAKPGEVISFIDKVDKQSICNYSFTPSNSDGVGPEIKQNLSIGATIPMPPVITSLTEDEIGIVTLKWKAPTRDVNGVELNPDALLYNIYDVGANDYIAREVSYDGTELTCDLSLGRGEQINVMMMVTAVLNGNESDFAVTDYIFAGYPYPLPYAESFIESPAEPRVLGADGDDGISWRILDDFSDPQSQDGDNAYLCMIGQQADLTGRLSTGKLDFTDIKSPYISFYTYVYPDDDNEIAIEVLDCETGKTTVEKTFYLTDYHNVGWTRMTCRLNSATGKVARVIVAPTIRTDGYTPLDNMVIGELPDHDLSVTVSSFTPNAEAGTPYKVNAIITNFGGKEAKEFTASLFCDNRRVDTFKGGPIASFESAVVEFTGTFSAISREMPEFKVRVESADDVDPTNNVSEPFNIAFIAPIHPTVKDLTADEQGQAVNLSWSAPDMSKVAPEESLEDFESYPAFTTELNGFTMVDADKGYVAGFRDMEMPVSKTQQAYWTMTNDAPYNFLYTLGKSSLFAMASINESSRPIVNDDWLISPELYGGRQTITFYACSQSITYGAETFEVWISNSDTTLSNFEKLLYQTMVSDSWTEFKVSLPDGTKYFAIRCTSNDCMLFTLDNITYIAKGTPRPLKLIGYNVYRNEEKLNSEPVTATTFATSRTGEGDSYFVTAVYDKGESTASNLILLGTASIDNVEVEETGEAIYYDLRGIRVNPDALAPGLYLRRIGSKTDKVIIR